MLFNIIKFEIQYRLKRPATYIYFGLLLILAFCAVAIDGISVGTGGGQVKTNAPIALAQIILLIGAFIGMFVTSAIMGVPIVRDFEHKTSSMIFTTPIKKRDYLFGRFIGSFIILLFVMSGILFGLTLGTAISWPWLEAENYLSFNAYHLLHPFVVFLVPTLFFTSALFFAGGALSRNILFVFVQGILLFIFYSISDTISSDLENKTLAGLLDPFGIEALGELTNYWTVAEQNTRLISLTGVLLLNRILWLVIGILVLAGTYFKFSFNENQKPWFRRAKTNAPARSLFKRLEETKIPKVRIESGFSTHIRQIMDLSILYFREIIKSVPFLVIVLGGMVLLSITAIFADSMYDTPVYPTTATVVNMLGIFNFFFIIIIIFYSGQLIWRERDVKVDQIFDSLPIPSFVTLISKFLGFMYVHLTLILLLIITGIFIQISKGYFKFELLVYFKSLFGFPLPFLFLYTLLALFIQVIVNNKFVGYAIVSLLFIISIFYNQIGLEHNLFQFASGSLGDYSDMNNFGHFFTSFSWFKIYWLAFASFLFALSVVLSVRGTNAILKTRIKLARMRFARPILIFTLATLVMFASTGFYIFYNTNIINKYQSSDSQEEDQVSYEKTLKQYEFHPKPKMVEHYFEVDIYPESRDYKAKGYYILKNKTQEPIQDIHIQKNPEQSLTTRDILFTRLDSVGGESSKVKEEYKDFKYTIYQLDRPLIPGDSLKMSFEVEFLTKGFVEGGSNTRILHNGTFFDNTMFPRLGYDRDFEISDKKKREKKKLPVRERMYPRDDARAIQSGLFGDNADHIRFEIIMSTHPEQTAIAPGYLQKEWTENGRRYFHYKMDKPMAPFYSMVSAKYEVKRDTWNDVNLEIYYHKGHAYNLDRMMRGMKKSLEYYTKNFSPYQYRQLRIMEFPRYRSFAQSFANTVPFSEGIGFMTRVDEKKKDAVDMAFYVTAHEVAHQWWGHQVTEAGVKGNAMLSESMSQYAALMVMKQEYPTEMMEKFLKYELDKYLRGRAFENSKEMPLAEVEGQQYIHYQKGSLIMYALQDYISEDSVNKAFSKYCQDWAWREDRYPTTDILLGYIREVTPDSLQYIIKDLFETITLFENRVEDPTYRKVSDTEYVVTIPVKAKKYRADSLGIETSIAIRDWIDIGVYGKTTDDRDSLLYLKKHLIDKEELSFEVTVNQKPEKAGIDPIHKLIDRKSDDNTKSVKEAAPSS